MTQMFRGPFARWAWSMATGREDEPIFIGTSNAWIHNSNLSDPDIRFKGRWREKEYFFKILRREQMRQGGKA